MSFSGQRIVSSGAIIAMMYRNFGLKGNDWVIDAVEWVGEALGIMNLSMGKIPTWCTATVKNYKIKRPCNAITVAGVLDLTHSTTGCRLFPYSGDVPLSQISTHFPELANAVHGISKYQEMSNYIEFGFSDGKVKVFYSGMPTDAKGWPLIPDDAAVKQALTWYVLKMFLQRGEKHPTFNWSTADAKWDLYYPRAQNACKRITPERMAKLARTWVSIIPNLTRDRSLFVDSFRNFSNENGDISEFTGTTIV